ncbi:alkyl hydroperoxide reductase subunit F [Lacticaseibacillus hulanensis]|uniref:alkyl hydroperoxide reductase subunit F n=1 Tax=Lacticaseibacillus hulanensis TaxID=2493111 RepID=UPI000FD6C8B9|nr:alkyl hydroperoxide reductase subunit F [Lacticaseibacillus hulanensis]
MLDAKLKEQLKSYFKLLEHPVVFRFDAGNGENGTKTQTFLREVVALDSRLSVELAHLTRQPSFTVDQADSNPSGIVFAGIPLGHEFESFVLAVLQVSGHAPKITDAQREQIQGIKRELHFETFASLSCHNCPDVVQALNIMSVLNPHVSSTMIEGGMFQDEATAKNIMAVPTVFLNGQEWHNGRATLAELLAKLAGHEGQVAVDDDAADKLYDVLIIGGGPAAGTAAIYAARKGLATAVVADHMGGQPLETVGIENLPGTDYVTGEQLMTNISAQLSKYQVTVISGQTATSISGGDPVVVALQSGQQLRGKTVIIATGAHWHQLGVPGEEQFRNKGVAYCPHCDGPLYKGKDVAVVGGGNSGLEAAIDLAGIARHVTVLEFAPKISADAILQSKAAALKNVELIANAQTTAVLGDGRVTGLRYTQRDTNASCELHLDGVFVQIGLVPNTEFVQDTLTQSKRHEIMVDKFGATSMPHVFAAGDCTDSAYKQIVIAMGSGATAALSAFGDIAFGK